MSQEPDRFDEFALGVKKNYRPDWLDSENKLFINKLNFVAQNYTETHSEVKNLKKTVYTDQQLRLDDYEMKYKDLKEEHMHTRIKLESMENNLPKMIREMIDFYTDQKLNPKFEQLVQKQEFRRELSIKMDYAMFNEYMKQQQ